MIKFFRKIRQQLLGEAKTGKYLKYALGEILLVMIGILLALQVNNWNEFRKDRITLKSHFLTILENLSNNSFELSNLKRIRAETKIQSTNIINKYKLGQTIKPEEYVNAHMMIAVEQKFNGDLSGFELIRSSPLFDSQELNEIRGLMVEYIKKKEEIEFYEHRLNLSTETLESEMWSNGFYDTAWSYFRDHVDIPSPKGSRTEVNFLDLVNKTGAIRGFFMRTEYSMKGLIPRYDKLIQIGDTLTVEVRNYIDSYLNN